MAERQTSQVVIQLDPGGAISFVGFRDTPLVRAVERDRGAFDKAFIVRGADTEAEVSALKHHFHDIRWLEIRSGEDLSRASLGTSYGDLIRRLSGRYYGYLRPDRQTRLERILRGPTTPQEVIEFLQAETEGDFRAETDAFHRSISQTFARCGVVLHFTTEEPLLALVVTSFWLQQSRRLPLVIVGEARFPIGPPGPETFTPNVALFDDLAAEIHRTFGTSSEEVEKAYRVWQISRKATDGKPKATTPKYITMNTARAFLGVLTRARTDREEMRVALQRPAPVMFALDHAAIGLKHGISTNDPNSHIAAAASSLLRQVERLLSDHSLSNVVPSAGTILEVSLEILVRVRSGTYSDADIVELGMDFNALQWHVDAVRSQVGDATLGELTGLFSSVQMLLARFKSWREFESPPGARGAVDSETVGIAVALLESARGAERLFTQEANTRIDKVLERATSADAPNQQEGLVRSGENLAAITAESLSRIALDRATSNLEIDEASEAMVNYARVNGPNMTRLAKRRNWPWLNWLGSILE